MHKDIIYYHAPWNATKRTTPSWLRHVPGLAAFSYPTCTTGTGYCNQMARLTSNTTNLKPLRICKCHKRSFSDGFARTGSILGLMQWYGDNVLRMNSTRVAHNLYQTTPSTTGSNALTTPPPTRSRVVTIPVVLDTSLSHTLSRQCFHRISARDNKEILK